MRDILLVRPESRWRWLPLGLGGGACAFTSVASFLAAPGEVRVATLLVWVAGALASAGWLGFFGAWARARTEMLRGERVRVATHAVLGWSLVGVGAGMVLTLLVSEAWPLFTRLGLEPEAGRTLAPGLVQGGFVALIGWTRPWELAVVDRPRAIVHQASVE